MARALRAWAINRGVKNSVRNLRYGPRTRLVRGIYFSVEVFSTTVLIEDTEISKHILLYYIDLFVLKFFFQVYSVVDEMFLAGEIRETSQSKVLKQLQMLQQLE